MSVPASSSDNKSWVLAVVLAWAVPGLGHWYLGKRGKAVIFFICIIGLFIVGLGLGGWRVVTASDLSFVGQALAGVVPLMVNHLTVPLGKTPLTQEESKLLVSVGFEMGWLYTLVAGLLNLLVMLDSYLVANNIRRAHHEEEQEAAKQ